jgi:hypothetical protein
MEVITALAVGGAAALPLVIVWMVLEAASRADE